MGYLAIRDHATDAEGDGSSKAGESVGRNVGILIGAIAAIIILSPLIAKMFGFSFKSSDSREPYRGSPTNRTQHLDGAHLMRLCARRQPAPRIVKPPPTVLTPSEIDIVAPELTYSTLIEAKAQGTLSSVHIQCPTPAVIHDPRHNDDGACAPPAYEEISHDHVLRPQTRDGEPSCSICLEGFTKSDVVRRTICGHIFHGPCLKQWLTKRRSRCPLCQTELKMREIGDSAC